MTALSAVRADFPILRREIDGAPIVYLDSGNTSQKPNQVIDAMDEFQRTAYAPINRSAYRLAAEATDRYEGARAAVARLINAPSADEIVFTKNATESLNLIASSWGGANLREGDAVVLTHMEHHANIVPWQILCEQTGAVLRVIPITRRGEVDFEAFRALLSGRTRLLALAHVSNALGSVLPVARISELAHARGAVVVVDGAQAAPHQPVDVRALGCDFYAFSGHKLYGPTGIGALYGRESQLASMPPWQWGGDMILTVSFAGTTYNSLPYKFEAGTPNIAGAVALGAAVDYVETIGLDRIAQHEADLLAYATGRLAGIDGLSIIGTAPDKASLVSFVVEGVHPHDLGTILDAEGVAIRTGHHCAMPVMEFFGVPATARASFALYNTEDEIDRLAAALRRAHEVFA